jgi:hypothetical protein
MEKRFGRLATRWHVQEQAVEEASWAIWCAVRWPHTAQSDARAEVIRDMHRLDDADMTRAIQAALQRCGLGRFEASRIATLGLEQVLAMAGGHQEQDLT